jgi:hypothetical protein
MGVDWNNLAQVRVMWWSSVNTIMNLKQKETKTNSVALVSK